MCSSISAGSVLVTRPPARLADDVAQEQHALSRHGACIPDGDDYCSPRHAMRCRLPPVVLAAEGLRKSYGDRVALKGVSLEARAGERVACIGPNGAGKTTLLTILAGIQAADAGAVRRPGATGWVPQAPAVYDKLSAAENLRLFARLERVADVEGAVDARCSSRPGCASAPTTRSRSCPAATASGSTSRSACCRARPCCCWTSRARRSTRASASACGSTSAASGRDGTAVVYATHTVSEAERYADRVLVLADGERSSGERRARCRHASAPGRSRPTSSPRSSRSSGSGPLMAASDAQAARQGPAHPAALAAAPRRCWCSTRWWSRC